MKRVFLLEVEYLGTFKSKIKNYNKLLAKKYISMENNETLSSNIEECNKDIKSFLEKNSYDYLEDIDIEEIKEKYPGESSIRILLNKNFLDPHEVKILLEQLSTDFITEELIRFLRVSLKKEFAIVMYYFK